MRYILGLLLIFVSITKGQVNASLQLAGGDNAWHAARPTATPLARQMVLNTTTGQYKIGDGTTQLQNLPYYSGVLTGSYVPYSGATTSLNLGANNFSVGGVAIISSTDNTSSVPLTVFTNTANLNGAIFTNRSNTFQIIPLTLSGGGAVYNGPWIGSPANDNFHLTTNIFGSPGVPQLTIAKTQNGNNPVILNGNTSYTSSAILRVVQGGLSNLIEAEGTVNNLTWILQKGTNTANMACKGYATIGSTVLTAGQPSLLVIGNYSQSAQSFSIGSTSYTAGNSGTISVLTDNYFTINSTFNIQALSASTTYYWSSNHGLGVRTTVNQSAVSIPYNCTLIGASICAWNAGSSTSQTNSTLNFRVNNTTDNVVSSAILWNTGSCNNCGINSNVTGLNVSLNAGDTWENKLVLGALATPPNNGNVTVTYYFARR